MKKLLLICGGLLVLLGSWSLAQNSSAKTGWGGAAWVWDEPDANQVPQNNEPRYLRRTFDMKAKASQAELWITADNHYIAYINGQKIGEDAEWATVEKYDVAKHLVEGKNVLAIKATNQGGPAGVIARLYVATADKKEFVIATDSQTKITQKVSSEWLKTDFDDSSWFAAIVLGDAGIGPWNLAVAAGGVQEGKNKGRGKNYGSSAVDGKLNKRLSAEEQKKHFIFPEGFEIELVVADPIVINPITMTMDDKNRIIVSESHTYRYGPPGSPIKPYANPVIRLDPDGKGSFKRTLVADGFDDPVMGIAVKDGKVWLTANNYLYQYDLAEAAPPPMEQEGKKAGKGIATNKKTLVIDKNKAWNPFGMFVLEWGPDGLLYMSVGNHGINLQGPDGSLTSRGGSGLIARMNADGSKMQRLVHGLRVPYSFEFDPFAQLWVLSNGEGNPDRFVRVLDGVDYHCYSRGAVDNNWLAGNHPLAPPCDELHGGAHTQLMRYYGAAFPDAYQGNLFCCNWGRHGFAGPNRGIFRFVTDERNNVIAKETLLACTDPHFRPSHILLDPDGNLLVADWYGRDDESDMTGRIWRLKYVGKEKPIVKHKLDSVDWKDDDYAVSALGSPHHLIREKATNELIKRGDKVVAKLKDHAASAKDSLGAANALWALVRIDKEGTGGPAVSSRFKVIDALLAGVKHSDWKVRRLTINILRRYNFPLPGEFTKQEADPAVRVEAALALASSEAIRFALLDALNKGAGSDEHLRYEAAWHLAKHADLDALAKLLSSEDADVRLAGLIAIDIACYENFPTKKVAQEALVKALESPGMLDQALLLTVANLDGDVSIVPGLEKMLARDDLPTATIAKAVLVLKAKTGTLSKNLSAAAGKRLIEAVEKGSLKIASPADQLVIFEFLESEGPTPFALKQIGGQLRSNQPALRQASHTLARRFGTKSAMLSDALWSSVFMPKAKFDDAIESLSTIARIEAAPRKEAWEKMLTHDDTFVRAEAVRWWRSFKEQPVMIDILVNHAADLLKKDDLIKEDLATVFRHLGTQPESIKVLKLPDAEKDKDTLTKHAMKELTGMPAADRQKRAAMGLQVFERNSCTKCHTTATQTTALAPSLKGIAAQKVDYLIESVLYPSKIIKTGFESESIVTTSGKVVTGLVKEDGKFWRVLNQDKEERIAKTDVESRSLLKVSIMPEGQETTMSRREFVDLIAFLATLK